MGCTHYFLRIANFLKFVKIIQGEIFLDWKSFFDFAFVHPLIYV